MLIRLLVLGSTIDAGKPQLRRQAVGESPQTGGKAAIGELHSEAPVFSISCAGQTTHQRMRTVVVQGQQVDIPFDVFHHCCGSRLDHAYSVL
ncbi:hypothetical protein A7Y00_01120 [Stenotrophomonas maltophilia]|nr:hypothetical protein A7Y00_01120 [Stenotrophomonas maltophilia]